MELTGKLAMVTGAARRVGRSIALALASAGCDIVLHYHTSHEAAVATAGEIEALGRRVRLAQADLAQPDQIERMFEELARDAGRLDVLVNNASIYDPTPIDALTAQQWDRQNAVNARAPALCIRYAAALMPAAGGAIVNITDISAEKTWPSYSAYCASKAALLAVTKSAAKALAPRNIRVNAVAPGVALWSGHADDAHQRRVLAQIPMKRIGTPEDVAAAVVFLARSDYITAQNLRVDGGWHMA